MHSASRELKDYDLNLEIYMAEERMEIVKYCIEHNCNYKNTVRPIYG